MPVIPGRDIPEHELAGNFMSGLATPSRGAREVMVWRNVTTAGAATPPHYHDHEQVVVVLGGSGSFREGEKEYPFAAGDVVIEPAHTVHQIVAGTHEPLHAVAAMPAGNRTFTPEGEEMKLPWAE